MEPRKERAQEQRLMRGENKLRGRESWREGRKKGSEVKAAEGISKENDRIEREEKKEKEKK